MVLVSLLLLVPLASAQSSGDAAAEPAHATDVVASSASGSAMAVDLRSRIEQVKTRTDLAAGEGDLVLDQLTTALGRAESAESARRAAEDYTAALRAAPATIAALGDESTAPEIAVDAAAEDGGDPVRAQLALASMQAQAVSLRSRQRALEETLAGMASRPAQARAELVDLRSQLDRAQATVPANASPLLAEAGRLRLEAAREDISARIEKTEQELLTLPTRESIALAQGELNARRLKQAEARITSLQKRVNALRQAEATQRQRQAQAAFQELQGYPEPVRQFAARTTELRAALSTVNRELDTAHARQERVRTQLQSIEEARRTADQILGIGPVGDENGQLLRGLSKDLPSQAALQQQISASEATLLSARVARLQNQQVLRSVQDAAVAASRLLADAGIASSPAMLATMQRLIVDQRAALDDLQSLQGQWIDELAAANALDTELMQRTAQLRTLLDERLLWLPSASPLNGDWFRQVGTELRWLATPGNWAQLPAALAATLKARPLRLLLLLACVAVLLAMRKRLTQVLEALAEPVGHRHDSFRITLSALLACALLALPLPLLIETGGWALRVPDGAASFARALGFGMISAGVVFFMLGVFQRMCRPHGLFTAHFGWDPKGTRRLGRALRLLALVMVPAALVTGLANAPDLNGQAEGLGRLGFVAGSLALALFMYRVFRPHDGALTGGLDRQGGAWRTRHIWFWVLVVVPLVLAVLAAAGYVATASALQGRLFTTGWIILAIIIAYQVAMRGVVVAGRRAAYEQAAARHAKARAAEEAQANATTTAGSELHPMPDDDDEIDVVNVSQQTRALLRASSAVLLAVLLWGIWSGLLPALNVFNDVVLWSHVVTTDAGDSVAAVTLGHVLIGLLALVLTVIAARNLPGFLEIAVLQRFKIDPGTRYAIGTIARYLILAIGLLVAFNRIGADWSKLQWIIAALGVGLGFGLQEIVANFVSGIIILFERPVRVGDLVTIGTTSGTVTRIRIRAITITDFDNFEVLVPNKAFITDTVQNWTLTSPVTRLMIKLGIAYGSDVAKAQALMLAVAADNPQVLSAPAPSVLFVGFGDSALEFEMRAYVGKVDQRLSTQHELNTALATALAAADIQIPFPQRDVHLRHVTAAPEAGHPESPAPPDDVAPDSRD